MSDFKRMPTQDEVGQYDPAYISDMRFLSKIYAHQSNDSAAMSMFENQMAAKKAKDGIK